jgi:hypothetical protein
MIVDVTELTRWGLQPHIKPQGRQRVAVIHHNIWLYGLKIWTAWTKCKYNSFIISDEEERIRRITHDVMNESANASASESE